MKRIACGRPHVVAFFVIRYSILLVMVMISPALVAQQRSIPISPVPEIDEPTVESWIDSYGPPDLALGSLLAYRSEYAGLAADISLSIFADTIDEIIFAFPLLPASLRTDADRVLKRLLVDYGPAVEVLSGADFSTHRWRDRRGELVHTVVYTPGREQHVIRTTGAR